MACYINLFCNLCYLFTFSHTILKLAYKSWLPVTKTNNLDLAPQPVHIRNTNYSVSAVTNTTRSVSFILSSKRRALRVINSVYYKSSSPKIKSTSEIYKKLSWIKARVMYFANNWIYTTNHKRIAINYFFFVLFSGTCGMALATIIRLEMAYPGVGILAGDSLQYLAIVTAHAVIMVFFMIMPLLFGAYSNFLLPTQLGVHDVAFPRLNSAAFWFLPAGLIMLAQLVCLDRRYQRMNCFNMRELQALLKEKYYPDLINSFKQQSTLLNSTHLRYKLNDLSFVDPKAILFANNNLTTSVFYKSQSFFIKDAANTRSLFSTINYSLISLSPSLNSLTNPTLFVTRFALFILTFINTLCGTFYALCNVFLLYVANVKNLFIVSKEDVSAFSANFLGNLSLQLTTYTPSVLCDLVNLRNIFKLLDTMVFKVARAFVLNNPTHAMIFYKPEVNNVLPKFEAVTSGLGESVETPRVLRFNNPIIKYDYKLGNYLPKSTISGFPNLITSQVQVTGGVRKSAWFNSAHFIELFQDNVKNYLNNFSFNNTTPTFVEPQASLPGAMSGFYNLFYTLNTSSGVTNPHWILNNSLNQKFYRIFLTSSIQQRIYANWRQLKFSREAWRCKLLAARHQKTLYNRYLNEDGVFWSVERNAKDVLPGWAMITPFSARTRFTAIGKVDIGLMGVFLVLNSSIVSSANFLVTYRYLSTLNNRKRRDARSFFTEGIIVASWMMIAANPMLAIGILMLLSDRHWQTSFFDYSGGGDTVLFQHMFWFFGHPEVYVIMIPAFGFNNTILSFYLRKRVSARASLMYSMYTIAFLGFFVWGHHMYMVGLAHTTRMLFSTLTVMISVPAATKLMHWCVTLVNSSIQPELPLFFALVFVFFFVSGGISGMAVAHTGMDILFHDTYYVIGHFHVMLAGSAMFASFGAFYFYFPAIFGVKFSRVYGYIHFVYYLLGQLMTVIPMFWLGYSGMPRRVLDYPAALGGWHSVVSAGHLLSVAGMVAFFIMIFDSLRQGRAATRNSFGISRFNTRLNFYLYETSKMLFIQRKCWFINRRNSSFHTVDDRISLVNHEIYESSSYSYIIIKVL